MAGQQQPQVTIRTRLVNRQTDHEIDIEVTGQYRPQRLRSLIADLHEDIDRMSDYRPLQSRDGRKQRQARIKYRLDGG